METVQRFSVGSNPTREGLVTARKRVLGGQRRRWPLSVDSESVGHGDRAPI